MTLKERFRTRSHALSSLSVDVEPLFFTRARVRPSAGVIEKDFEACDDPHDEVSQNHDPNAGPAAISKALELQVMRFVSIGRGTTGRGLPV